MSPPRVSIEVPLSIEGLLELRDAVDRLLRDLGQGRVADFPLPTSIASTDAPWNSKRDSPLDVDLADRMVAEVWDRVGDKIKLMLLLGADLNGDADEFSFNELAEGLDVPVATIRSWHRNLGRTLKSIDDDLLQQPELMIRRSAGARQLYHFEPEVGLALRNRRNSGVPLADWLPVLALGGEVANGPSVRIILRCWARIEQFLANHARRHDIELDDPSDQTAVLADRSLISFDLANQLQELHSRRNAIVHESTRTLVTREMVYDYVARSANALANLRGQDRELPNSASRPPQASPLLREAHLPLDAPLPPQFEGAVIRVLGSVPERAWSGRQIGETIKSLLPDGGAVPDEERVETILLDLYQQGIIHWVAPGRYRLKPLLGNW